MKIKPIPEGRLPKLDSEDVANQYALKPGADICNCCGGQGWVISATPPFKDESCDNCHAEGVVGVIRES